MRVPRRRVTWLVNASLNPMGQQGYEESVMSIVPRVAATSEWAFERRTVSNLRFPGSSNRRIPVGLVEHHELAARLVGGLISPRSGLVHRMELKLPPARGPEILTIHDLAPMVFDDEGALPHWFERSASNALGCIVPSEWAASEVKERLPISRVWVIPNGVDQRFARRSATAEDVRRRFGLDGPFVLNAGGASKRKNLAALAEAWPEVHARTGAVLAMSGPPHVSRTALFENLPGVRLLGRVSLDDLVALMQEASALVVPSVYEGFGMQVLEAMLSRCPVVCTDRTALAEVSGDAAHRVEPDAISLGRGLVEVLTNSAYVEHLRARGVVHAQRFSWERSAAEHLAVYEEARQLASAR